MTHTGIAYSVLFPARLIHVSPYILIGTMGGSFSSIRTNYIHVLDIHVRDAYMCFQLEK